MAGNRRQQGAAGTKFQDLQEKARRQADNSNKKDAGAGADSMVGGGLLGNNNLMGDAATMMNDPEMLKQYEDAMAELSKMSPEQLQAQMAEAMNMLTQGDMMEEVLKQKDAVLQSLQESGAVPPEELARYKTDDAYFEMKMRESFGQMQEIFNNPDYMKMATETMHNMAEFAKDPSKAFEGLAATLGAVADDDEKIEEARLEFLSGGFDDNPLLGDAFKSDEMKDIINNPTKWRNAVKEGFQQLAAGGGLKEEL